MAAREYRNMIMINQDFAVGACWPEQPGIEDMPWKEMVDTGLLDKNRIVNGVLTVIFFINLK